MPQKNKFKHKVCCAINHYYQLHTSKCARLKSSMHLTGAYGIVIKAGGKACICIKINSKHSFVAASV